MVYTICIGSNEQRQRNMAYARRRLSELFPGIRFSTEEETLPLQMQRQELPDFITFLRHHIAHNDNQRVT